METRSVRRRTVALVAAYAVALQALLAAFVPVELSILTAPFAVLCSHDDTGSASHPAPHDLPCGAVCAALGHGVAGPLPPDAVVGYAKPLEIAPLAPINWVAPRIAVASPQAPRGPPLA